MPNRGRALRAGGAVAVGLLAGGGLGESMAFAAAPADAGVLLLNGVTVVDTGDGRLSPNMTIVIERGSIAGIVPAGAPAAQRAGATVVDARGTFAVPGFIDMHSHPLSGSDPQGSLTLMLANGITGFRQLSGSPQMLAARAAGTLMPPIAAPELLELPGEILTPANAATPEAAVAEVQRQKAQGADFIKVIEYSPAVMTAVAAECKRLNLRFLGHLPPVVNVRDAAAAGMRSIEHMGPRDAILLGCSADEAALRETIAQSPPRGPAISGPIPDAVIARVLANPTVATDPAEFPRYVRVMDTFSAAKARDLAGRLAASGTWLVPTLIRIRTMLIGDDPRYLNDPNLRYVPVPTRQMWAAVSEQFSARIPAPTRESLKRLFDMQSKLVKPFKDAGVNVAAGSDSGGFEVAGFALHQEFDLLAAAGLSPLEILQMTTRNAAKFLGRETTMGSVAAGKDANLVLLDANPVASAANLHRIAGVVRGGAYYSSDALEALKKKTADRVAAGVGFVGLRPPCC